ncbi:hypothetical protein [Mycoplasmopsis agassizii]|uniref:DUF31 domain-containing protein n=1 Tax=Mycoplasmopsis agassizii TaxID=33922 RepID=A0ABX4H4V7_9BACT|nr:hypothetical protein [Mycoplasmopsis agassizii]PAF54925.1 hypothetical protein CJF60_04275 [Mycoplasmopsis agassizii]SMC17130.1 hypothetical protein SAMN02745179_00397 [Mycoplasmopsis agassizii]
MYETFANNLEPLILSSVSELEDFINKWSQSVIKTFGTEEESQKNFKVSLKRLIETISLNTKLARDTFNEKYFEDNLLIIDFGNQIEPKSKIQELSPNKTSSLDNLLDIYVKENKIYIVYDVAENLYNSDKYQSTSVIYSLNKKMFDLKSIDYKVEKIKYDTQKRTPISERILSVSSFITQDLSQHQRGENSWIRDSSLGNYGLKIFKTKQEFDELINGFVTFYNKKHSKIFSESIKANILNTYNSDYFDNNYLLLFSAMNWGVETELFSDYIEHSYNITKQENTLLFTLNASGGLSNDAIRYEDLVVFENKSKDTGIWLINADGQQHTLFFKIARNAYDYKEGLKLKLKINKYWRPRLN